METVYRERSPGVVRIGWRVASQGVAGAVCPVDRASAVRVVLADGVDAYVSMDRTRLVAPTVSVHACAEQWVMRPRANPHARNVLIVAARAVPAAGIAILGLPVLGDAIQEGATWYTVACVAVTTIGCGVV